jgi:hypothetical protein
MDPGAFPQHGNLDVAAGCLAYPFQLKFKAITMMFAGQGRGVLPSVRRRPCDLMAWSITASPNPVN